jgi:hypothetical protein
MNLRKRNVVSVIDDFVHLCAIYVMPSRLSKVFFVVRATSAQFSVHSGNI